MLCPLKQDRTFEQLAHALDPLGLDLVDVRSCTFPSRPEPECASWKFGERVVMRYKYEPDLELRGLELLTPWPDGMQATPEGLREELGLFEDWRVLERDLAEGGRARMIRACAAWRWRATRHPDARQREDALGHLLEALAHSDDVHVKRQVCMELRRCATPRARVALERAGGHADLEVRLHARDALRALDERAFLLRRR